MWFVEFYAPWCGHCKSIAPEYDKLAKALDGIVRVGGVDMTTDQAVGQPYDVKGFPTIKFFGLDKTKPIDYTGDRSANDMLNFAMNQAKQAAEARLRGKGPKSNQGQQGGSQSHGGGAGEVVVLTDSEFDELVMQSEDLWLVEFYAPWCGHCQRLEPEWNEAANKLKGEVKVGKIDATTQTRLAQQFGISGYPSIKMFPPGKKSMSNMEDYGGTRDASSIVSWALDKKLQFKPVLKVEQLVDREYFEQNCVQGKGICLLAFLPHIYDTSASERNAHIEILQEIQKANRVHPIAIIWSQGGDQYETEEALELGSGYPSLIAVSVSKMKYATMKGAFAKKNIESFINGLITGKESLFDLKNVPKFKPTERWDGKDAKPHYEYADEGDL